MITEEQKDRLMEMVKAYGVDESIRGVFIGGFYSMSEERQRKLCEQKLEQIQNFLNNITSSAKTINLRT